jgi:hypothetical protein
MGRKVDNPNDVGFYTWENVSTNKNVARRILTGWADILLSALNEAKNSPSMPVSESD